MQACLDVALPYTVQRKQFGKPIGEGQMAPNGGNWCRLCTPISPMSNDTDPPLQAVKCPLHPPPPPAGEFQLVQGKLADMYTRLQASRAYMYKVGGGYNACAGALPRQSGVGELMGVGMSVGDQLWLLMLGGRDHIASKWCVR